MLTDNSIQGKVAIVTGAARGIGQAAALQLAANGAHVYCADVSSCEETVSQSSQNAASITAVQLDVSNSDSIAALTRQANKQHGGVDIAVHCAGIIDSSRLNDMSFEEMERVLSINLMGTLLFAQSVLENMRDNGRLVLLASLAARTGGLKTGPSYAASKGGVISFIRWAAREYAARQITINGVAPGPVVPGMIDNMGYGPDGVPLGRMGTPEDIAQAIIFFASEGSSWITGQTLDVNGGLYLS